MQWLTGLAILAAAAAVGADLLAWSWDLTPEPGQLFTLLFLQSLFPLVTASIMTHFLIYQPLKRVEAMEKDPLAQQVAVPYPKWGLSPVRHVVALYDDYRLHREAYTRLTEAYRSSCLAARPELNLTGPVDAYRAAIDQKLAQSITLYQLSTPGFEVQVLAELKHAETDAPLKASECSQNDIAQATKLALSRKETEFVLGEELFQILSREEKHRSDILLVRIKPRKLWSRLPKVYRRYFQMAGVQALSRENLSASKTKHTEKKDAPRISRSLVIHHNSDGRITNEPLPDHVGYALSQGSDTFGGFLALAHHAGLSKTCVILGDVSDRSVRGAHAVTGTIAVIAEHLQEWHLCQPAALMKSIALSIHRYHSLVFPNGQGVTLNAIHFDHRTAEGLLASFGQPLPYLLTPHERKPMVVAPLQRSQALLGTPDPPKFQATRFSILPGQVLVSCTQGLLVTKNGKNRTFEKEVSRGKLATLIEDRPHWPAQDLADGILTMVKGHAAAEEITDDLTVVTLQTQNHILTGE